MGNLFEEIIQVVQESRGKGGGGGTDGRQKSFPLPSKDKFGGKVRLAIELGNLALEAGEYCKNETKTGKAGGVALGGFIAGKMGSSLGAGAGGSLPAIEAFQNNIHRYLKNPDNWAHMFHVFLAAAGPVAMGVLQVLQGSSQLEQLGIKIHGEMQAHTGLDAPEKFSRIVLHYVESETSTVHGDGLDHLYFLYHPDTDWHGWFWHRMEGRQFPKNFIGMSEHLELLCAFMLFTRRNLRRSRRRARLHLLIPSYRPMAVRQPYAFSEELFPMTVHGVRHDAQTRVWLNLPTMVGVSSERFELKDVENIAALPPPPTAWQQTVEYIGGLFTPPKPPEPVMLGVAQPGDDDGSEAGVPPGSTKAVNGSDVTVPDSDGGFNQQPQTRRVSRRRRRHREKE